MGLSREGVVELGVVLFDFVFCLSQESVDFVASLLYFLEHLVFGGVEGVEDGESVGVVSICFQLAHHFDETGLAD